MLRWVYPNSKAARPCRQPLQHPHCSPPPSTPTSMTVAPGDCKTSTVYSYQNSLHHMTAFFPNMRVSQVDLAKLTVFRSQRGGSSNNLGKQITAMRAFFSFCLDRKWISENPARRLKPPKGSLSPTMPFEQAEIDALLVACDHIENHNPTEAERARLRARALILPPAVFRLAHLRRRETRPLSHRSRHRSNHGPGDENPRASIHQSGSRRHRSPARATR